MFIKRILFSQGSSSSGNVGFPDISRIKTIIFNTDNSYDRHTYMEFPNLTFVSGKPYVIPEDGWIYGIEASKSYRNSSGGGGGHSIGYTSYKIYWYVNDICINVGCFPIPVKKGDVVKIYNTYTEACRDAYMTYVPNRK